MANLNQPNGFKPVGYINSSVKWVGGGNWYYKAAGANALGMYQRVIRAADSSDPEGGPMVVRAAADGAMTGVVVGVRPLPGQAFGPSVIEADQEGYVLVADDPNLVFEVQQGGTGTDLAITNIGQHIDATAVADPNLVTGFAVDMIDIGALATGNCMRIERLSPRVGNLIGQYSKWYVSANLHTEAGNSTTYRTEV